MAGLPDVDSFATYGGLIQNYAQIEDPSTDRDGPSASIAYMNVAALTQTCVKAWARVTLAASTGAMILLSNDGVWPNIVGNQPAMLRNSAGNFTFTWPTTLLDANGVSHTLSFRAATCTVEGGTWGFSNALVSGASTVTIQMANLVAGVATAADLAGVTVLVAVY